MVARGGVRLLIPLFRLKSSCGLLRTVALESSFISKAGSNPCCWRCGVGSWRVTSLRRHVDLLLAGLSPVLLMCSLNRATGFIHRHQRLIFLRFSKRTTDEELGRSLWSEEFSPPWWLSRLCVGVLAGSSSSRLSGPVFLHLRPWCKVSFDLFVYGRFQLCRKLYSGIWSDFQRFMLYISLFYNAFVFSGRDDYKFETHRELATSKTA
ncbi:hypothetical protein DY000_02049836 [Brassica cretica]|uniref:Uncharacterized protein n=1 Tax=Brassica cretica TaxID=69181 RepID=A0ABQ7EXU1_BRACR|nr:hypothetical protein DY000_02049836 [Brassica cretica]